MKVIMKKGTITHKKLNSILKAHDLGDDFFEKNFLFDEYFSPLSHEDFEKARVYANDKINWYFTDTQKHYLLADCNRFHWMWCGYFQEYCTQNDIYNPAIGRAYGTWEGQGHAWAYVVIDDLIFINYGQKVIPEEVNYSGKGSSSV
jgi:hypothetical protein